MRACMGIWVCVFDVCWVSLTQLFSLNLELVDSVRLSDPRSLGVCLSCLSSSGIIDMCHFFLFYM